MVELKHKADLLGEKAEAERARGEQKDKFKEVLANQERDKHEFIKKKQDHFGKMKHELTTMFQHEREILNKNNTLAREAQQENFNEQREQLTALFPKEQKVALWLLHYVSCRIVPAYRLFRRHRAAKLQQSKHF